MATVGSGGQGRRTLLPVYTERTGAFFGRLCTRVIPIRSENQAVIMNKNHNLDEFKVVKKERFIPTPEQIFTLATIKKL